MTATIPEFRPAQGFVFQSIFQNEKEQSAYDKTLDAALDEIDTNAFRIPAQSGLTVPNPYGCSFKSDILSLLIENLYQHEMPSGGELWYRAYDADEPVRGLRIEFWGAAMHPLPPALTARTWFTARNRPWEERGAPIDAAQGGGAIPPYQIYSIPLKMRNWRRWSILVGARLTNWTGHSPMVISSQCILQP